MFAKIAFYVSKFVSLALKVIWVLSAAATSSPDLIGTSWANHQQKLPGKPQLVGANIFGFVIIILVNWLSSRWQIILIIFGTASVLLGIVVGLYFVAKPSSVEEPPVKQEPKEPGKTEISWEEAVRLIRDCQVTFVFQTHSLDVDLTFKDGTTRSTQEPEIDLVLEEASKASGNCGFQIDMATE